MTFISLQFFLNNFLEISGMFFTNWTPCRCPIESFLQRISAYKLGSYKNYYEKKRRGPHSIKKNADTQEIFT